MADAPLAPRPVYDQRLRRTTAEGERAQERKTERKKKPALAILRKLSAEPTLVDLFFSILFYFIFFL